MADPGARSVMRRPLDWRWMLATLVVAALGARLGVWQLDRARQKLDLQASMQARADMPALPSRQLAQDATTAAGQWHRPATVTGRWWPQRTVLLDNRQMGGRPGFFVLTPLRLTDGGVLMVQRGWLPRDPIDRVRVEPPLLPVGEVIVSGRIAPPPSRLLDFGDAGQGLIRQNLDLDTFAAEISEPLLPVTLLQLPGAADGDGLARDWPRPAVDVSKNHGYAFQWFSLSALVIGLYAWFQFRQPAAAST
ncbi:MAG: SURF1 family protein [Aquabacterium sp.]